MCSQSADTVKMLSATQQTQEEVERTKQQLSFEIDRIKQDSDMKVCAVFHCFITVVSVNLSHGFTGPSC